jgi:alanine transaminase
LWHACTRLWLANKESACAAALLACRITLPAGAVAAAEALGKPADWLYCSELLDATGIVVVPGSGFGQKAGTLHFRTTFLPPEEDIEGVVQKLGVFHKQFLHKYGGL